MEPPVSGVQYSGGGALGGGQTGHSAQWLPHFSFILNSNITELSFLRATDASLMRPTA